MRLAQIGAGRIGELHASTLAAHPLVDELIVADLDSERAQRVAVAVGARAADPQSAMDAADALVIAAATDAHPALIRAGIARGIPIFSEKPLALDLEQSARLVAEIEASGVPFQLGFQRRFDAAYREARRMVLSGEIGRLYQVRMTANDHAPPPEAYIPTSGGLFRDSSIHDFDAIRYVTGSEVETIYVEGAVLGFEMFARYGDIDTAVATMRMSDGTLVTLAGGRHNPLGYDIRIELLGSRDAVAAGLGEHTPIRHLDDGPPITGPAWESFIDRFAPAYRAELTAFVEVAAGRAESVCTARDGLEAMRIAEAAARSLAERRPVTLQQINTIGEKEVLPDVLPR
ncbi:MAG: Gfo/Idh/MocA family oxidoreductase [Chloroflexota bacterium]|nr:Gfo/Idh/MocA family oxidoreductase [Chloroflexota bacterium]